MSGLLGNSLHSSPANTSRLAQRGQDGSSRHLDWKQNSLALQLLESLRGESGQSSGLSAGLLPFFKRFENSKQRHESGETFFYRLAWRESLHGRPVLIATSCRCWREKIVSAVSTLIGSFACLNQTVLARNCCNVRIFPRVLPQLDVRLQSLHHFCELWQVQRLRAVADCFFRSRMHFNHQRVGADGHSCAS